MESKEVVKVVNNERKKLTHHEIIDRIAEKSVSVIIQVSKESKLRIHLNLNSFKFHLNIHLNSLVNVL